MESSTQSLSDVLSGRPLSFTLTVQRNIDEVLSYLHTISREEIIAAVGEIYKQDSVLCTDILFSPVGIRNVALVITELFGEILTKTSSVECILYFSEHYCGWPLSDVKFINELDEKILYNLIDAFLTFNKARMDRIVAVAKRICVYEMSKEEYITYLTKDDKYKSIEALSQYTINISSSMKVIELEALCRKLKLPYMNLINRPMKANYLDLLWLHSKGTISSKLVQESIRLSGESLLKKREEKIAVLKRRKEHLEAKIATVEAKMAAVDNQLLKTRKGLIKSEISVKKSSVKRQIKGKRPNFEVSRTSSDSTPSDKRATSYQHYRIGMMLAQQPINNDCNDSSSNSYDSDA